MQTLDVALSAITKTRSPSKSITITILNNVTPLRDIQFPVHEGGTSFSEAASGSLAHQVIMLLTKKGTFTIIIFSIVTITTNIIVSIILLNRTSAQDIHQDFTVTSLR